MQIRDIDRDKRETFHFGDFVSHKVEEGYVLSIYKGGETFERISLEVFTGDDELKFSPVGYYVVKADKK